MMAGALTPTTAAALARVAASVPGPSLHEDEPPMRPSANPDAGYFCSRPLNPWAADEDDEAPDVAEEMSRNPAKVSDWMSDVACAITPPDAPVPFADLLNWTGAQTFEGLMTALIGGTEQQAVKAVYELRASFNRWAEERVNG